MKYLYRVLAAVLAVPTSLAAQSSNSGERPTQGPDCLPGHPPRWTYVAPGFAMPTVIRDGRSIPAVRWQQMGKIVVVPADSIFIICAEMKAAKEEADSIRKVRIAEGVVAAEAARTARIQQASLDSVSAIEQRRVDSLRDIADEKAAIAKQKADVATAKLRAQQAAQKAAQKKADYEASVRSHGWSEKVVKAILGEKIFVGMTAEQARLSWGKPDHINKTVRASGVSEQWVYGSGQYVYFNDGILTSYQTSN